jgi:hypothetical protein
VKTVYYLVFPLLLLGAAPLPFGDPMDSAAAWPADSSSSVIANSASVGGAVRMTYDFGKVSGYAYLRRKVALDLPRNFEIRFRMRGTGRRNDLQLKLTDGDNVWWKTWRNHRPSAAWQDVVVTAGEIGFAWGPSADKTLRHADGIEFVVARNRDGGHGTLEIDDLRIVPLTGEPVVPPPIDDKVNDALKSLAKAAPRGTYPRAFVGEQPYWTLAGSDGGKITALIDEDAAIEPAKGSYSLAPSVTVDGKRYDWANVTASHRLADGALPIPAVEWTAGDFTLTTELLVDWQGRTSFAEYSLTNRAASARQFELRLQLRPWQVNPPAQFLAQKGGASPIGSIVATGNALAISQPQFEGDPPVVRHLVANGNPRIAIASQPASAGQAMQQADFLYPVRLGPKETRTVTVRFGREGPSADTVRAEALAHWRDVLGRVRLNVPASKRAFADTVATSLAHMLMSREGPMLKPGTRSYDRAWIRDGAMMGEALLRMGRPDVARAFADWYRPYQFADGKVPCCVDFRGSDPVPENDSHGEYIFLIAQLHRYTGDRAALERDWPSVLAAARYIDQLRLSERTAKNQAPARRMLYGLMPPSISHEGYSAKPEYSLWDDFWTMRGLRDAADIATILGKPDAAVLAASRNQFDRDLHAAIFAARDHWKIAFIPGATSLGDFDATSTTIAFDPGGEQGRLDDRMVAATFERYWRDFQARADGTKEWKDYTPYETRTIGTFVRLGWRDRLGGLLDFFLKDRRPGGWNQWAEVVGRDPREVRFIGDMPHAWVASDFIRGALDMFAWDHRDDRALVLGGGLSSTWLAGQGSSIRGLSTPYGSLDFGMRGNARKLSALIGGSAHPPGGFVLEWPFAGPLPVARVDGKAVAWRGRSLRIQPTGEPIRVEIGR